MYLHHRILWVNYIMHQIRWEYCLAVLTVERCILIRAHDQNTVIKQRIGKFLRPRDKNNGSLSWFIQFSTYLSRVYYMPSTILGVSDTDVINKEKNLRGVTEYLSGVGGPYFICNSPCFRELNWHVKQWSNVRSSSSGITF